MNNNQNQVGGNFSASSGTSVFAGTLLFIVGGFFGIMTAALVAIGICKLLGAGEEVQKHVAAGLVVVAGGVYGFIAALRWR